MNNLDPSCLVSHSVNASPLEVGFALGVNNDTINCQSDWSSELSAFNINPGPPAPPYPSDSDRCVFIVARLEPRLWRLRQGIPSYLVIHDSLSTLEIAILAVGTIVLLALVGVIVYYWCLPCCRGSGRNHGRSSRGNYQRYRNQDPEDAYAVYSDVSPSPPYEARGLRDGRINCSHSGAPSSQVAFTVVRCAHAGRIPPENVALEGFARPLETSVGCPLTLILCCSTIIRSATVHPGLGYSTPGTSMVILFLSPSSRDSPRHWACDHGSHCLTCLHTLAPMPLTFLLLSAQRPVSNTAPYRGSTQVRPYQPPRVQPGYRARSVWE